MARKHFLAKFLLLSALAPGCTVDDRSGLLDDAYDYTGKIRLSLTHPSNFNEKKYNLAVAGPLEAETMTICVVNATITSADTCKQPTQGAFGADLVYRNGDRSFFIHRDGAKLAHNLLLRFVARDKAGTVVDERVVEFYDPALVSSTTTTTTSPTPPPATPSPPPPTAGSTATTTAGSNETKGSGGPQGYKEVNDPNGLDYAVMGPSDNSASKAHGLLIFLHGSSSSNFPNFARDSAQVAQQLGLISIAVRAPNGSGWNETDGQRAAQELDSLVQNTFYKMYNVDKNRIYFHGQSSGSGFLSSYFIALYGHKYRGGALMLCGAQVPEMKTVINDEMKRYFKLYYDLTTEDGIWTEQLEPASRLYKEDGLTVQVVNNKPGGHCAFDQQAILSQVIPQIDASNK